MICDAAKAQEQLEQLVAEARRHGAEAADAILIEGRSIDVSWHGGRLEALENAEGGEIGLRVLIGHKQAMVSGSDRRADALRTMADRAVSMARAASEDPFCGLADVREIAAAYPALEMADSGALAPETLMNWAKEAEEAALSVSGVTRCESASAGGGASSVVLVSSNGFRGTYSRTHYSISVAALAGEGTAMERDYDVETAVFGTDLPTPFSIGKRAGERAIRSLGARKMPSQKVPVVFDQRASHELLSAFVGAVRGTSVARGTSFLKDCWGQSVFPDAISVVDEPHRARGLRSRPFDGEGLATRRLAVVDRGRLDSWLLDLHSARQLGMNSTAHASRGCGAPAPSPSNLYLKAENAPAPEALIRDIKSGFYVTEMMGSGINGVTGDFSQAARGFWIENGAIGFPVSEMTIAGNLKDMFRSMAAANDLVFRYGIDAPTLRVESMTVAGI